MLGIIKSFKFVKMTLQQQKNPQKLGQVLAEPINDQNWLTKVCRYIRTPVSNSEWQVMKQRSTTIMDESLCKLSRRKEVICTVELFCTHMGKHVSSPSCLDSAIIWYQKTKHDRKAKLTSSLKSRPNLY